MSGYELIAVIAFLIFLYAIIDRAMEHIEKLAK